MCDIGDPVVWRSDGGDARPPGSPSKPSPSAPPTGPARVRLERQGRGGKVVTVVENLSGHRARIEELARALKARCGAGGTTRGKTIEIQGDHRDRIVEALGTLGVVAKRAGG